MTDDAQLLRLFVEGRSEPAFAELVHRHLALVYHAAARQLGGEADFAPDVAQGVFILLAEKSRSLVDHPSIVGWLHSATHFKVSELRRAEHRRRLRENAAQTMSELMSDPASGAEWERMRPVIDDALLELSPTDREAVLLRFFENRPFAEIGARLQLTEQAAHKRVERALDRLRERLEQRGVTSTAAALATLLGSQAALAAPAGLASNVIVAVVASCLPAVGVVGILSFMSTKTSIAVATIAVLVGGAITYELNASREAANPPPATPRENVFSGAQVSATQMRGTPEVAPQAVAAVREPALIVPAVLAPADAPRPSAGSYLQLTAEQIDAVVGEHYDALFGSLGLLPDEAARLRQLLKERQQATITTVNAAIARGLDKSRDLATISAEVRDAQAIYDARIKSQFGETVYAQYEEFDRTIGQRNLVADLNSKLVNSLTEQQSRDLVRILAQNSFPEQTYGLGRLIYGGINLRARITDEAIVRAGAVLSASQVETLRDLQRGLQDYDAQKKNAPGK